MIDPAIKWMLQMLAICAAILFAVFGVLSSMGCVSTYVKTDKWECKRVSFCQSATMPRLSMTPSGTIKLEGYSSEVDPELVKAVQMALETIIKAGVAVP